MNSNSLFSYIEQVLELNMLRNLYCELTIFLPSAVFMTISMALRKLRLITKLKLETNICINTKIRSVFETSVLGGSRRIFKNKIDQLKDETSASKLIFYIIKSIKVFDLRVKSCGL